METTGLLDSSTRTRSAAEDLVYLTGFGNTHASEVIPGSLPVGQNSPQRAPRGLYAEQVSGTAFTSPRAENRRTWCYRILPSAMHPPFEQFDNRLLSSAPMAGVVTSPNRLRWDPLPIPSQATDFVEGLVTLAAVGDAAAQRGVAVHLYCANRSMVHRVFVNSDGELLVVPQDGALLLHTEMGRLFLSPGEIAVIPRGIRFRVELSDTFARGYVCENYGQLFRLPELGPIGSNGLANVRDFLAPTASYELTDSKVTVIQKFLGRLWIAEYDHSPLDVVAWHGNYYPYKYDLTRFMAINTVTFDHADPSIFTVLTSPSHLPGTADIDFVVFPPRWSVAEHTFRPPWFHRNVMSEYMGLINGQYDVRTEGFKCGGGSLHNCMSAHGPDPATFARASTEELKPVYLGGSLAFMFESRLPFQLTKFAQETVILQRDYDQVWASFERHFEVPRSP